jgi:hypothetical protein
MRAIIGRKFESSFKRRDESNVNGNVLPPQKSPVRQGFLGPGDNPLTARVQAAITSLQLSS